MNGLWAPSFTSPHWVSRQLSLWRAAGRCSTEWSSWLAPNQGSCLSPLPKDRASSAFTPSTAACDLGARNRQTAFPSHVLGNQSLFPWDSGGPKFILQAGCQASTSISRHIPTTCSSREASLCKFDLTIPRNNFFHCYFPFLPHQLQALKSLLPPLCHCAGSMERHSAKALPGHSRIH